MLFVTAGGAAGVLSRWAIVQASASIWAIVAVNVVGSFLLGVLMASARHVPADLEQALGIGFLGGFTTFSTFSMHVIEQADAGRTNTAFLYLLVSVTLGIAAAAAGFYGTRALT